jgi:NADP-dependent 3-hydroxy acid dehydrogenase YdfG
MSVSKKFAAVTGAGSGIGRAAAIALAQAGFTVALLGRTEASLRETQDAIRTAGGDAHAFPADVTDEASVDHAFAQIAQQFGRLDVLFNNAGRNAPPVSLDEYEFDVWNSVVATNLTGVFLCARAAWRLMKAQSPQGGRIINNGSISAHAPRPDTIAYTATKHAVTGITVAGPRRPPVQHRVRPDRHRQRGDIAHGTDDARRPAGRRQPRARGAHGRHACRERDRPDGEPAARHEHPEHDDHGDRDAVRRPRLNEALATPVQAGPQRQASPADDC